MAGKADGPAIDFQKVFTEKVTIHFNAPVEPEDGTTGGELLHGYLCDIYRLRDRGEDWKNLIDLLIHKWNVVYIQ